MHLTIMQMQQFKDMTNMEIYNVFMHLVMTFQSTDVFMLTFWTFNVDFGPDACVSVVQHVKRS